MSEYADTLTLGNVEAEPVEYVLPNSKDFTSPLTDMSVIGILQGLFFYCVIEYGVRHCACRTETAAAVLNEHDKGIGVLLVV